MADITQTCTITGKTFLVTEWEQSHIKKFDAPLPTICIEERHRRRYAKRNGRNIYSDVCDLSGKPTISLYSPDKDFKVYSQDSWWSDDYDPTEFGMDYDFNRPFFEQYAELTARVPKMALVNVQGENSEYCNMSVGNKNCYLVFGGDFNEDSMYSIFNFHCSDVSDMYWTNKCELAYDCTDCSGCYNVKYCRNTANSRDSQFLFECRNLENCFGCVGLRNKKYHIFNKQYSPEEYKKEIAKFRLDTWSGVLHMKEEFKKFRLQFPTKALKITNCENVTGDRIVNAKNCQNCFDIEGPAEDIKDVFLAGWDVKDVMSCSHVGHKSELLYEEIANTGCSFCAFSFLISNGNNIFYSDTALNSQNLFGCNNIKNAEFCILNKQYTEPEFNELRARIVEHMRSTGEWGNFFPISISPYAYNETVAQDYMPMSKEDVLAKGWKWHDEEKSEIGTGPEIADSISDVTDDILQQDLICKKTGRAYRIIASELKFYRKMGIPIPRHASATRNEQRIATRNMFDTWDRSCEKCSANVKSSFAPDTPEKIYCEKCYLEEVY
ncbi:hypothetical protein HOD30_02455 [Candidatus Peregrinibacteria bacterium]|jgi:hypothetical protein|nr:hypothetical protein [Candidatus Peregrinibacteria bacterium]MBT4631538.1 hypothetical protein [Candidatus Peregrinibacteria bacterium]MBT5516367.1 hypothetical protein [Candidatus Peregrinibacteria bacterium]MBT5824276.1 hypothetical protein [Candidatus Peregrinibacteria bacterium]